MCISVEEAKRLAAQFNGLPYDPGTRYSNAETYDVATRLARSSPGTSSRTRSLPCGAQSNRSG